MKGGCSVTYRKHLSKTVTICRGTKTTKVHSLSPWPPSCPPSLPFIGIAPPTRLLCLVLPVNSPAILTRPVSVSEICRVISLDTSHQSVSPVRLEGRTDVTSRPQFGQEVQWCLIKNRREHHSAVTRRGVEKGNGWRFDLTSSYSAKIAQPQLTPIPTFFSLSQSLAPFLSLCLSVSLCLYFCLCLSVCLSVSLSLSLFLCLSLCLSVCLHPSLSLSFSLIVHPSENTNTRG